MHALPHQRIRPCISAWLVDVLLIISSWHNREDEATRFFEQEIRARGGGGCILAQHLLPELAYKFGRAAKYGA